MKKLTLSLLAIVMLLAFYPSEAKAVVGEKESLEVTVEAEEALQAEALIYRLHEIKNMDLRNLSTPDKDELRNEVIIIKEKLQEVGGGVYISVGALLIIILILILL